MTAPVPHSDRPAVGATAPPPAPGTTARRRRWLLVILLALAAAGGAGWWWLRPSPPEPPLPADVNDAETRAAIDAARQDVLRQRRSVAAWGKLGKVLLAQQFDREADVCLVEANRLDPTDPRWLYGRCLIVLKRDPDNAVAMLRHAATVADAAGDAWPEYRLAVRLLLAEALIERGSLDEAERILQAEAARNPRDPRVALALGRIALARDDDARAAEMLAIAQPSPHAQRNATALLAQLARRRGDKTLADSYERKLAQLPGDMPWPDALLDEIASMSVGPRGWERHVKWLEQHERYAEAAQVCLERIAREPAVDAYVGAAKNFAKLRDYDRAVALLREAVALDANSADAHDWLGLVLFSRAERDAQTTPDAPQIKEWLREAVEHARCAAELRPGHAKTYLVWGVALKLLGRPADAVAPLRLGVACDPGDLELQLGLGQVLLQTGHGTEAEPFLQNARRLAPPHDHRPAEALKQLHGKT